MLLMYPVNPSNLLTWFYDDVLVMKFEDLKELGSESSVKVDILYGCERLLLPCSATQVNTQLLFLFFVSLGGDGGSIVGLFVLCAT
jgi:hypothetical protein